MSRSNTIICAAKKCYSSLVTHPSKSFFGFPSDISLCKTWLENCGRTDLNLQQVSKRSHWRLCEDHFEDKWFTDSSRKILKRKLNPVPTIFINNISSLLPPETEAESIDGGCTPNPVDSLCVELTEEDNDPNECAFDLRKPSFKKHQLPISHHFKPLLKSLEFGTEAAVENPQNLNTYSETHNADEICRFCINEVSLNYVDMFSNTDDAKEIRKLSEIILPNKISACDGLPHKVCHQCIVDLKTCLQLIERFQNADQYLRSIANYSLFIENENIPEINIEREESTKGDSNFCDLIKPVQKSGMVLTLSPNKKTLDGCYEDLDLISIDGSLEVKNTLNFSEYDIPSNNSDDAQNLNWEERSINVDTANEPACNVKKYKPIINCDSKCYKRRKKISSIEYINETVVMPKSSNNMAIL